MGEEKFQFLLDELEDIRKLLLVYRLMHYNDKFPDIETNLENREKQLFKPLIRLFLGTDTINNLLDVISNFVNKSREKECQNIACPTIQDYH